MVTFKFRTPATFFCIVALFVFASFPALANPAAGPVVPGKSLGKLSMGMTSAQFSQVLGSQPIGSQPHDGGAKVMVWAHNKEGEAEDTTLAAFYGDKAIYIEAISQDFVAPGGVTTASNLAQVFAKYKGLSSKAYEIQLPNGSGSEHYIYSDVAKGISFIIWADDYFDHSRVIDIIAVHRPGYAPLAPLFSTPVEPILNKPRPAQKQSAIKSLKSPDGLPLTELLYPNGVRGWMSAPVVFDNGVGLIASVLNSYQGKNIPPDIQISLSSQSSQPRWTGITQTTINFSGRRILVNGEKSTKQQNNGDYLERLTLQIPPKDFLAISNSNGIVFEVGRAKLNFNKVHLSGFKALAAKLQ